MIFRLVHNEVRARAIEAIRTAPDGWIVKVTEPTRNLEQNAALHAELSEIAKSMKWCGLTLSIEQWKRLLTAAWTRTRGENPIYVQAIDGHGMEVIYQRTSTLSKSEMSELIEYVKAWHDVQKQATT